MRIWRLAVLAILTLAGCDRTSSSRKDPAIATAFAGPVTLSLRAEINPQSKAVATAKHGETIEVLQARRRFVRVRTPRGEEGWTEIRNLLGPPQMEALKNLSKKASRLPTQGEATVYSTLNMHSDPNRTSISFYQLSEGKRADVVGHLLAPKVNPANAPAGFRIEPPKPRPRKAKKEPKVPPPPRPVTPGLPANWTELSKTELPEPPPENLVAQLKKTEPKVQMEDWSLIRTKDGKAGWVLTRNITMAIPDEVAQYSEGARITSYVALGDVQDGDQMKHHWLWTTMRGTGEPYDFDSFRIFIWNLRKHRYETSYIERRVEGYYPVTATRDSGSRFSLILRNEEGQLIRRSFVLDGHIVRQTNEEPWEMKSGTPGATIAGQSIPDETDEVEEVGVGEKGSTSPPSVMDRLKSLLGRK